MGANADTSPLAFGLGIAGRDPGGTLLEVWFPVVFSRPDEGLMEAINRALDLDPEGAELAIDASALEKLAICFERLGLADEAEAARRMLAFNVPGLVVLLGPDEDVRGVADAYLKLHLLSLRHVLPNCLNLEGIFAALPTVAWTSEGPCRVEDLPTMRLNARLEGRTLRVDSIDKFPRMADYVTPLGVRIADASRVRLGAYLGLGVTVMHEGFVNFNAGARGPNMIEGRLSQGVTMAANSDLGGGSSTMGTLSGGGENIISIGQECLISANAGIGITLGDRCTIEAGLYVTPGMIVEVVDEDFRSVRTVKASQLAGGSDMLFVRNSMTGRVECRTNRAAIALNRSLHEHN